MKQDDYLPNEAYENQPPHPTEKGFSAFFDEEKGLYFFGILGEDGKVLLKSEGYKTASAREKGIKAVKKNRVKHDFYSVKEETGEYFVSLRSGNYREIARSGAYPNKADALNTISILTANKSENIGNFRGDETLQMPKGASFGIVSEIPATERKTEQDAIKETAEPAAEMVPDDSREQGDTLISLKNLKVYFKIGGGLFKEAKYVKAVDGVSLDIEKGETLGLVGESGCGKSTLGKAILRLTEPTGGRVMYHGKDLAHLSQSAMREQRKHLQMIFQDPYASLNPRMTVGNIIGEPIRTFRLANGRSVEKMVQDLMETVGLSRRFIKRYPHEFSGGQRQRIGIARALAVDPEFIVADEPISALDVSIQAQIMNLMEDLQAEKNLTYLFISHDLRAVRHVSDRVAVMYLGKIVELAGGKEIYKNPLMPYTQALISAVPVPDPEIEAKRERIILTGDVPSPINPPKGCHFHTRCPYAIADCKRIEPQLVEIKPRHYAACIRISPEHPHIEENEKAGLGAVGS